MPIAVMLGIGIGSAQSSNARETPRKDPPATAAVASADTKHVAVRATLSDTEVTPGARISVAVDITPKARMHVYAPGAKYAPVTLRIQSQPFVKAHDVVYPPSEDYFFEPLNRCTANRFGSCSTSPSARSAIRRSRLRCRPG
jgi:hypothetical protein